MKRELDNEDHQDDNIEMPNLKMIIKTIPKQEMKNEMEDKANEVGKQSSTSSKQMIASYMTDKKIKSEPQKNSNSFQEAFLMHVNTMGYQSLADRVKMRRIVSSDPPPPKKKPAGNQKNTNNSGVSASMNTDKGITQADAVKGQGKGVDNSNMGMNTRSNRARKTPYTKCGAGNLQRNNNNSQGIKSESDDASDSLSLKTEPVSPRAGSLPRPSDKSILANQIKQASQNAQTPEGYKTFSPSDQPPNLTPHFAETDLPLCQSTPSIPDLPMEYSSASCTMPVNQEPTVGSKYKSSFSPARDVNLGMTSPPPVQRHQNMFYNNLMDTLQCGDSELLTESVVNYHPDFAHINQLKNLKQKMQKKCGKRAVSGRSLNNDVQHQALDLSSTGVFNPVVSQSSMGSTSKQQQR